MSIFRAPFAIRAYLAVGVIGMTAPVIGAFLVQRRLALIGDGIGHLAFAGVALGLALGIAPLWGALIVAGLGALVLEKLRAGGRISGDLSLALIFFAGISAGAIGLSALNRFDSAAVGVLFGSVLTASWADVLGMIGLSAVVLGIVAARYRQLLAVALDEETARASGMPVQALNLLVVLLTAFLVAAGMRAVGLLLISALLVVPVAAGARLSHSFRATIIWGSALGLVSALGGLLFAIGQGTIAPGGAIVMTSLIAFVIASVVGRRAARRHPRGSA